MENFGGLAETEQVDPAQRSADRRHVARLLLEGSAFGRALTLLVVIAPV